MSIKIEETKIPSQDDSLTNWSDEDNPRLFVTNILQKALKVNINERNSKVSKENSINLAKLNEITSTNAVENDYSDLQIEAKPIKKDYGAKEYRVWE